jgi:hypothetical protein
MTGTRIRSSDYAADLAMLLGGRHRVRFALMFILS